jgi:hypothetical protein
MTSRRLRRWLTVGLLGALLPGCRPPAKPAVLAPQFSDVTTAAGLQFVHDSGAFGKKYYPERMGSGVAFLDANGDGHLDLFLVNGAPLPGHPRPRPHPSRLYLNRGDGTFVDRTQGSGLEAIGYGMGVAAGDVDNDGDVDLFVTRLGQSSLYLNRGDGTFTDGTRSAGLSCPGYATSAAFLDGDGDGLLDLYVCRYVPWNSPKDDFRCLDAQGQKQYCSVHVYPGLEHRYFRNRGGGRFEDATRQAGISGHVARGLAIVCGDYDRDGDPDLFVANDETPNFLWRIDGHGKFEEVAAAAAFAYNERGIPTAGMGLDIADVDGDGDDDVIESDFQGQRKTLYVSDGQGFFTPNGENKGLGDMPRNRLGFGIGFLDFDLDSWPDVFIANGHVNELNDSSNPFRQTAQLFHNEGHGAYTERSVFLGAYGRTPYLGRGVAFGDIDNDGDADLLIGNNGDTAVLLRNDTAHQNHWLGIRCTGKRANRSALGARVTVTARGRTQSLEVRAARSYLSSSDPRLLFGLGAETRVEHLTVEWPGGAKQEWSDVAGDRYLSITEGDASLH